MPGGVKSHASWAQERLLGSRVTPVGVKSACWGQESRLLGSRVTSANASRTKHVRGRDEGHDRATVVMKHAYSSQPLWGELPVRPESASQSAALTSSYQSTPPRVD